MVTANSNGRNGTTAWEVVMPDRMHTTTEIESGKSEHIYIGKDLYTRRDGGAWEKSVNDSEDGRDLGDLTAMFRDPSADDVMSERSEVKYLGEEPLGGASMLVYQCTMKVAGTGIHRVSKIWVGADDNLQHQVVTEMDSLPHRDRKTTHFKSTLTFYDYDADIRIEPPV